MDPDTHRRNGRLHPHKARTSSHVSWTRAVPLAVTREVYSMKFSFSALELCCVTCLPFKLLPTRLTAER